MGTLCLFDRTGIESSKNYIFNYEHSMIDWAARQLLVGGRQRALYTFEDFQYIRIEPIVTIKAAIPQGDINWASIDYAALDQGGKSYYFFVNFVKQISPATLELRLELDVLNTFYLLPFFTEKTHITREHKQRFTKSDGILTPVYDKFDEGFTPQLIRISDRQLDFGHEGHFYLMYMKDNVVDPHNPELTCQLTADFDVYFRVGETTLRLRRLNEYDRRMQELYKIIELPYAPFRYSGGGTTSGSPISVPSGWSAGEYAIPAGTCGVWLDRVDSTLYNVLTLPLGQTPIGPDYERRTPAPAQPAFVHNDPKLYTSAFYQYKMVYDSWSWQAPIDDLVVRSQCFGGNDYGPVLNITFTTANTMNSKFGFKFSIFPSTPEDDDDGVGSYYFRYDTDFGEYMIVSRNNELPIYNDEYLNYIKSGYNYDKKVKAQQEQAAAVNTAATIAGSVLSTITIALAASGVGAPIAAATGAVGAMGLSLYNLQNQISLNNQSLDQKLNLLSKQSIGVSGVDDVSLLKWYSGDRLHEVIYRVRDDVRKMLNQLFHYFGYRCDYYGIPQTNTRYYFNFLQCDPDFDLQKVASGIRVNGLTQDYLAIARDRFKQGVTFFHRLSNDGSGQTPYILTTQQYENWENVLL